MNSWINSRKLLTLWSQWERVDGIALKVGLQLESSVRYKGVKKEPSEPVRCTHRATSGSVFNYYSGFLEKKKKKKKIQDYHHKIKSLWHRLPTQKHTHAPLKRSLNKKTKNYMHLHHYHHHKCHQHY